MAYLELAENGGFNRYMAENSPEDLYIFVPDTPSGESGKWVREDYFDNLDPVTWERVMEELADYQPEQLSGLFSGMRERIAERRERRTERRDTRQDRRQTRAEGGGIFGGIGKAIGGLFGGGQDQAPVQQYDQGGRGLQVDFNTEPETFWDKNKMWIIPAGGVVVIGGIYLLTKKKK